MARIISAGWQRDYLLGLLSGLASRLKRPRRGGEGGAGQGRARAGRAGPAGRPREGAGPAGPGRGGGGAGAAAAAGRAGRARAGAGGRCDEHRTSKKSTSENIIMNSKECELEAQLESINAEVREIRFAASDWVGPTGCQCRIRMVCLGSCEARSRPTASAPRSGQRILYSGIYRRLIPFYFHRAVAYAFTFNASMAKGCWLQYGFVKGPNVEPRWDGVGMREPRPIHSRLSLVSSDRRQ